MLFYKNVTKFLILVTKYLHKSKIISTFAANYDNKGYNITCC